MCCDLLALGYPRGRVQVRELNTTEAGTKMVSDFAVAPDWAKSFNAYVQATDLDVSSSVAVKVAPGDVVEGDVVGGTSPLHGVGLFYAFTSAVSIAKGEANGGAVFFKRCSPGMKLRGEMAAVAANKDPNAVFVFEFSPNEPAA